MYLKDRGHTGIETITREDLSSYIEAEQDRGMKPKTVSTRLRHLYAFLRYLEDRGLVHPDIMKRKLRVKVPEGLPRAMDPEDVRHLLSLIDKPRDRAMILVLLRTGMRIGELLATRLSEVDLRDKRILIMEAQKTRIGRVVYLSEDACRALRVFPGNVSEPSTLMEILQTLRKEMAAAPPLFQAPPTVVIDAGSASAANLAAIQAAGFSSYSAVLCSRPQEMPAEGMVVIKETNATTIQVQRLNQEGEVILCCQSSARARKKTEMRTRMQKRFEEGLEKLAASLTQPRGLKSYAKVMERLGRLRERYPTIAQFYEIQVEHHDGQASRLTWEIAQPEHLHNRFAGAYYLRSNRQDLDEAELWSVYMMLNQVEDACRSLESELGLRPVYHRLDRRLEGHLFISVLAYHLLAASQRRPAGPRGCPTAGRPFAADWLPRCGSPWLSPTTKENASTSGRPVTRNPFTWKSTGPWVSHPNH